MIGMYPMCDSAFSARVNRGIDGFIIFFFSRKAFACADCITTQYEYTSIKIVVEKRDCGCSKGLSNFSDLFLIASVLVMYTTVTRFSSRWS